MAGIGPPPPRNPEDALLRNAREAEDERMSQRKRAREGDSDEPQRSRRRRLFTVAEGDESKSREQEFRTLSTSALKNLVTTDRPGFESLGFDIQAIRAARDELERRRASTSKEEEIKKFIADVQRLPLGVKPYRVAAADTPLFTVDELPDDPGKSILGIMLRRDLEDYLKDYVHLTAAEARELPLYKQRVAEVRRLKDDWEISINHDRERRREEEPRRFRREMKTLDFSGWEAGPAARLVVYLAEHYRYLDYETAAAMPEYKDRLIQHMKENLETRLRTPLDFTDEWLQETLQRGEAWSPLPSSFEFYLGNDYLLHEVGKEFTRRGLTQSKEEKKKAKPTATYYESQEIPGSMSVATHSLLFPGEPFVPSTQKIHSEKQVERKRDREGDVEMVGTGEVKSETLRLGNPRMSQTAYEGGLAAAERSFERFQLAEALGRLQRHTDEKEDREFAEAQEAIDEHLEHFAQANREYADLQRALDRDG